MESDPLFRTLERMSIREPAAIRTAATRARCHAILARQRRRAARRSAPVQVPLWESLLVAALCTAYLSEVLRHALQFYGML